MLTFSSLHLAGLAVEEVVPLLGGELRDGHIERARLGRRCARTTRRRCSRGRDGALGQGLALVEQLRQVDVGHRAHAVAARAHAAGDGVGLLLHLAVAALDGDRPAGLHRGDVERVRLRRPDVRLAELAEQDPQHRVGVGGGADGGARVGAHPFLVDDDRRGQALQHIDVRPGQGRHEPLHEGAVGLVDEPLRLRGDRGEDQRALAGAGDAGEHGEPALGQLDGDVLQVVLPRPGDPDQVVAVGRRLRHVRPRGTVHGISIRRGSRRVCGLAHRASLSRGRGAWARANSVGRVWMMDGGEPTGCNECECRGHVPSSLRPPNARGR